MRGSSDFNSLDDYRRFVDETIGRRNASHRRAIEIEQAALKSLPAMRTDDFEQAVVTVTRSSAFVLRRVCQSALKSFQATASQSFQFLMQVSAVFCAA